MSAKLGKSITPRPTESELGILQVLWRKGPSSVREVWEHMGGEESGAYTTTLKFLQIMLEKGLVSRDESAKTHIYYPAIPAARMKKRLVSDLLDRVFQGSVGEMAMQVLGAKKASREELESIRALLSERLDEKPEP